MYHSLLFTVGSPYAPSIDPIVLCLDGETVVPSTGWNIVCRTAERTDPAFLLPNTVIIDRTTIRGVPVVRSRRTGDRISLRGRGSRSLKRLFIDEKVPCFLRENIPVVADDAGVIAVCGFGADASRTRHIGADRSSACIPPDCRLVTLL